MAINNRKANQSDSKRGSLDEFEIIAIVLDENPALKKRVLTKIRMIKEMNKTFDANKNKAN